MSVDFRTKNRLFLLKLEGTPGIDAAPVPASDAIRVADNVVWMPTLDKNDTNYVQESVSTSAPIMGGGMGQFKGKCWLSGAATAGVAPDWATLLKAASFQETLTAADVTNTAQAGSANSITLHAGASATDDLYKGMPLEITGGTGPTTFPRVITAYNGTTKIATVTPAFSVNPDATSVFAIRKNARYVPISQGMQNGTAYSYNHGTASGSLSKLRKLLGAMATMQIALSTGKLASLDWTLTGQMPGAPTDVAKPAAGTFVGANPESFRAAQCFLGGAAFKLNAFSLDIGNNIRQFDDPSQAFGKDTADNPVRLMTGKITAAMTYTATRDAVSDFINATTRALWLNWGSAVGKRVSILLPAIQYTGNEDTDINGFSGEGMPFQPTGLDSELYIAVW